LNAILNVITMPTLHVSQDKPEAPRMHMCVYSRQKEWTFAK
jgi:hypothetical protein